MKISVLLRVIVGTVALSLAGVAGANSETSTGPSIAYKLAALDTGRPIDSDSIDVSRAQAALTTGVQLCAGATEYDLANMAVKTSQFLNEKNVYSRPVDVLEGVKAIHAGEKQQVDCADAMGTYVGVRMNGMTHSEAVASLRALINSMRQLVK